MRILYLLNEDISVYSGVVKKIDFQVRQWKKFGHEVRVVSFQSINMKSVLIDYRILSIANQNDGKFKKIFNLSLNCLRLKKIIIDFKPDIGYVRCMRYAPLMISVLKLLPLYIIEINTDDIHQLKLLRSRFVYYYNLFTRRFLLSNAAGFVSVTEELAQNNAFKKYNKPCLTIGNGIDVFKYARYLSISKSSLRKKAVFIGTPNQAWSGMDKLLFLSTHLFDIDFHVIGYTKEQINSLADKNQLVLSNNIYTYGYLAEEVSNEIISQCDVGIGSLALHRKNMKEGSPLKVRHYLALGLGVIIGYIDTDVNCEYDFILCIENEQDNVQKNIKRIYNFIQNYKTPPKKVANFALKYIDHRKKEQKRIQYLESFLS
jgi:glycosyltransferase involved in cell wall biosynthesis